MARKPKKLSPSRFDFYGRVTVPTLRGDKIFTPKAYRILYQRAETK